MLTIGERNTVQQWLANLTAKQRISIAEAIFNARNEGIEGGKDWTYSRTKDLYFKDVTAVLDRLMEIAGETK